MPTISVDNFGDDAVTATRCSKRITVCAARINSDCSSWATLKLNDGFYERLKLLARTGMLKILVEPHPYFGLEEATGQGSKAKRT